MEQLNRKEDFEILNSKILQKIRDIITYAPRMEPAHIGDKTVKFKRRLKIVITI